MGCQLKTYNAYDLRGQEKSKNPKKATKVIADLVERI